MADRRSHLLSRITPRGALAHATVVALLAAVSACGGDDGSGDPQVAVPTDSDAEVEPDATQPDVAAPDQPAQDTAQPDATAARDQADQRTEQPDTDSSAALEPIRLGKRFEWCYGIERSWNDLVHAQWEAESARAAYESAQDAVEITTDELDRAEALQRLEEEQVRYDAVQARLGDAIGGVTIFLHRGNPEALADPQAVALGRAEEAYRANADPSMSRLLDLEYSESLSRVKDDLRISFSPPPRAMVEQLPPADAIAAALAALEQLEGPINDLVAAWRSATQDLSDGMNALLAAERPSDLEAAHQQTQNAVDALRSLNLEQQPAVMGDVWAIRDDLDAFAIAAVDAGEIITAEHNADYQLFRDVVDDLVAPLYEARDAARRVELPLEPSDYYAHLWETRNAFAVADAAGMAAFEASLDESCEP